MKRQAQPVLEVRQVARSDRREGGAEWIALNRLAEAVPQGHIPRYEQIDTDGHSKRCSRMIDRSGSDGGSPKPLAAPRDAASMSTSPAPADR